jgi:hypothetical protein
MKTLNVAIVVFLAFTLGLYGRHVTAFLTSIAASVLQINYIEQEQRLSHIQLLAVKVGSTISLIMLILWVLWREFESLFLS